MKKKFPMKIGVLVFLSASLAHASSASHEINWWHFGAAYKDAPALGWLSITFLIFVFLVVRAVKKPLSLYLQMRSKDIARQIEEGEQAKKESAEKLRMYEEKLQSLSGEIGILKSTFMKQAKDDQAEKERLAQINEVRILRDVDDTIKSNFERSKNRLAKEVVELAIMQAQKIIVETKKDEVDQVLQDHLIKDFKMSQKELCLMSYQQVVARRYAKGLKLLLDKKDLLDVELQFRYFVTLFSGHPDLKQIFSDPTFSPLELRAVINNLAKKLSMNEQLHHFLLLLIERRRIAHLPAIFQAFVLLVDDSLSRLRATIKSATRVSAARLEEITKSLAVLGKKEILIDNVVDQELLAGIRVEVAGSVFDGTLRAKLDAMRSQLLHEIKQ